MSSLLFVPANDERKFQKASNLACSGIIIDLEDAVHLSQKGAARTSLSEIVPKYRNPKKKLYVRINGLHTDLWRDDLSEVIKIKPDGVIVPKAEQNLAVVDDYLTLLEDEHGLTQNSVKLILILETAQGIVNMEEILSSSPRIDSATIGMADLSADLGTSWDDLFTQEPPLLLSVREKLVLVSRKLGLSAPWDSVYMRFQDAEGFRRDAMIGKRLGFQGKHVIHPSQIDVVNDVYRVSDEEYAKAKEILSKIEGLGAVQVDGLLVDEPVVKRARQVIARYEEAIQ
jgi:citrate lyase subunit beta / citryl-CoA lyase